MDFQHELKIACDQFNTLAPVGTKVRYCKGKIGADTWYDGEVCEPGAFVMGGHSAMVKVAGDSIRITHVEIIN